MIAPRLCIIESQRATLIVADSVAASCGKTGCSGALPRTAAEPVPSLALVDVVSNLPRWPSSIMQYCRGQEALFHDDIHISSNPLLNNTNVYMSWLVLYLYTIVVMGVFMGNNTGMPNSCWTCGILCQYLDVSQLTSLIVSVCLMCAAIARLQAIAEYLQLCLAV